MMATMTVYLSGCLCLLLLLVVFKFIHKFWWTPICIQSKMRSQGIKGPSYKFIHGNFKEIISMRNGIKMNSREISHHILPIIQPHIYSWLKLFGRNFILWHGPTAQLYVTEPELIREILNDKDGAYPKRKLAYISKKLFGDGLATAQGQKWLKQRKLANYTFHAETLKNMIPSMIASVEMMLERWRQYEGKEIDVFQEFKVLTSEIISRTAFGSSYLEGKNIFNMLTTMVTIILRSSFRIRIPVLDKLVRTPDDIESDKLFKPERFAEGVAKATNNNMAAFLPFGLGPRTCVGLNFASIETKLTLSMILQRYKFTLSPTYVHSPVQFITVQPQHGLQVLLHAF